MKSPFPGMDPYIEACGLWGDFHAKLIGDLERALAAVLPERYSVRLGERPYLVFVGSNGKESHPFLPDVGLTSSRAGEPSPFQATTTAVAEPTTEADPIALRPFIEEEYRETFLEIYETDPEERLVTCIEVLSPSNKRRGSEGWHLYLRKRQGLLLSDVSLIEIDLLRGGERMPMLDPWPTSPYVVMVARGKRIPRCLVWRGYFQKPLPTIPVPLAKPDPDLSLNLQPLVDAIYERSRYARSIDYSPPLKPPLREEEQAWLAQQLRDRGGSASS